MKKIVVAHGFYGCTCECCGTEILAIETVDGEEFERERLFEFGHVEPYDAKTFAENCVRENWPDWIGVEIVIGDLHCPAS
jgi:hypothetical protein